MKAEKNLAPNPAYMGLYASFRRPSVNCPKCCAPMKEVMVANVTVERCTECRGIFLDEGELEELRSCNQ